ncbi:MAG: SDR family oxidoreductase [Rhodobacter sp.]|nr:SDR family oxidoreductase [Rhodobacter sp.]
MQGRRSDRRFLQGYRAKTSIERAGRPGTPEEIADLIAFLASPESHWIKGQDILIDGGISAMMTSDMMGLNQG